MKRTAPITTFWFIRDGEKLIQCSKEDFDKAIREGKSIKYKGYGNKKMERLGDELEKSRMAFLAQPGLSPRFRAALTDPALVVQAEVIEVDDPMFWAKESKRQKYL